MKKTFYLHLIAGLVVGAAGQAVASPEHLKNALMPIDPSNAQYAQSDNSPPVLNPSTKRTLNNPNPQPVDYGRNDRPIFGFDAAGGGINDAGSEEMQVVRLEQIVFGSNYPEHELDDRIDHLDMEVFGSKKVEQPFGQRLAALEAKLGGGGAFGAAPDNSARFSPNRIQAWTPQQSRGFNPNLQAQAPQNLQMPPQNPGYYPNTQNSQMPPQSQGYYPNAQNLQIPQQNPGYYPNTQNLQISPQSQGYYPSTQNLQIPPQNPGYYPNAQNLQISQQNPGYYPNIQTSQMAQEMPDLAPEFNRLRPEQPLSLPVSDAAKKANKETSPTIKNILQSIPLHKEAGDYFAGISKFGSNTVARWMSLPVRVHLPEGAPDNLMKLLQSAVSKWSQYLPLRVIPPSESADIEVAWINHLPPKQLGLTNLEVFNGRMRVTVYLLRPTYYLPSVPERALAHVALHEIGHALGLFGHSSFSEDVMYPLEAAGGKEFGSTKSGGISSRDLNTLRRVYESAGLPSGFQTPHPMGWTFQK